MLHLNLRIIQAQSRDRNTISFPSASKTITRLPDSYCELKKNDQSAKFKVLTALLQLLDF
jgi:hypothetical protein